MAGVAKAAGITQARSTRCATWLAEGGDTTGYGL